MESKSIYLGFGLLAIIIAGMFGYSYLASQPAVIPDTPVVTAPDDTPNPYATITRIDAKHFYADGEHTIVGVLTLPTPCEVPSASATVAESFPEQVTIDIAIVTTAEMCAQVLTEQRFQVTAVASEGATFTARLQGRPVELNLIPASAGETPDTVEFFEKG